MAIENNTGAGAAAAAPQQPAAQQAAPAASPAVQARFAEDDSMVRVKINGEEKMLPVSVLKAGYQTTEAGRQMLDRAKALREASRADEEHARAYRDLERRLRANPEEGIKELARTYGAALPHQEATEPDAPRSPPAQDRNTSALQERLAAMEARINQSDLQATVKSALDSYPLLRTDEKARGLAEKQVLAELIVAQRNGGTVSVEDVVRDVHTDLFQLRSQEATAQRDQRQENLRTMPNVPSGVGIPDLSDIPKGSAKAADDGSLRSNLQKAAARFLGR